ncbi:MAG: GGDEF domain-containing protein [Campylobacterales bacterium]|nr:GGDEF domain-containing protein [Campylobacterales bacterium]
MKMNLKFTLVLIVMLTALLIATLLNVALNFRSHALQSATDKAEMTATIVREALTAHMVNGTMDHRHGFLDAIAKTKNVEKLWIVRAPVVSKQFGEGLVSEIIRDEIDQQVIESGQTMKQIQESSQQVRLRITIPYVATVDGKPNCLSCHQVPKDTVLGAISMEFDISDTRNTGTLTILKILGINIIFLLIAVWLTNHYLKPFMEHFNNLKEGIDRAYLGDFSFRFRTSLKGEGAEVTEHLNHLFKKMDETFGQIKTNLSTFLTQTRLNYDDPLQEAQIIIKELSDIYKFKKTIELDVGKAEIYDRIVYILTEKFGIKNFAIYEIRKSRSQRHKVYITDDKSYCTLPSDEPSECRAYRTDTDVISTDFPNLCEFCSRMQVEYICIPFTINDDVTLTLTVYAQSKQEIEEIHRKISSVKNYLETAKPVIESRILMDQLRDSSLRDGLTGLYNRRFLEEFIDKLMHQAMRENVRYSILMIDIDYFKLVNDTYGHDVGDIVIKGLAAILQSHIRASDLAIRYGGEEFTILLHNATPQGAMEVAAKIQHSFNSTKFHVGVEVLQKTLSIGVACFPTDEVSIWKVIKYADTALYEAKHTGRNKVVRFTPEMFSYDENGADKQKKA